MDLPNPDQMKIQFLEATTPPPQKEYVPLNAMVTNPVSQAGSEETVDKQSTSELEVDAKMTQKLEAFYKKLIYDLPESSKHVGHIDHLAKPRKKDLVNTYQHKDVLHPEGRRKRIKRRVTEMTAMTTEQLEQYLQKFKNKKKDKEIRLQKRQRVYREMLQKFERQTRERILNDLFRKFSHYICHRAVRTEGNFEVYPANVQRLIDCIDHNICETCKIIPEERKENESLYKSLANCIGSLIVETLCEAQIKSSASVLDQEDDDVLEPESVSQKPNRVQNELMNRAMIAVRKRENTDGLGSLPNEEQILKLAKILECR